MCAMRRYPCVPWPSDGYPDWQATATLLRSDFGSRFPWLEADLFREAFSGSVAGRGTSDSDRADLTKNMSVALILDHNLPLVTSMVRGAGLFTEHELHDIVSEALTRAISKKPPVPVYDRLCEWHDANQKPNTDTRRRLRARCIRDMVRSSVQAERNNRLPLIDDENLRALFDKTSHLALGGEGGIDLDRARRVLAAVLNRYSSDEQFIFTMYHVNGWTLQGVRDELEHRGTRMSIATVHNRLTEVLRAMRDEYER